MRWTFLAAILALATVLVVVGRLFFRRRPPSGVAAPGEQNDVKGTEVVPPRYVDENVLFTVYRPPVIAPSHWYTLVAFAHLAEKRPGAPASAPTPQEEVKKLAARYYGPRAAEQRVTSEESRRAIPEKELLTFVPVVEGATFNPQSREVRWVKDVHAVDFELLASPEQEGRVLRGSLTVFAGGLILADVPLSFEVDGAKASAAAGEPVVAAESARPYDKIFPSYSRADEAVVEQFESYVESLGHRYLRDVRELRAGEVFDEKLMEKIREAEVFQLFWSWNAMASEYVRKEWSYALSLGRPNFVRPTYWEVPRPASDTLPPPDLDRLHFYQFKTPHPPLVIPGACPTPPRGAPGASIFRYGTAISVLVFGCFMLGMALLMPAVIPPGEDLNVNTHGVVNVNANGGAEVGPTATPSAELPPPELVALAGGRFRVGRDDVPLTAEEALSKRADYLLWMYNQWPAHAINLRPFAIDRTEVTNAEYAAFIEETGHPPPPELWSHGWPRADEETLPIVNVTYEDALAFAAWRSRRDGAEYRLPTEEEWEYAARGGGSLMYPWGRRWSSGRANLGGAGLRPVGSFPEGRTPQGVDDMIGNAWEWTRSEARMYAGNDRTVLSPEDRGKIVVRGGSYESAPDGDEPITATSRRWVARDFRGPQIGFRLVRVEP